MTPAPVIIAIDGRSGAGKTTLAMELAALLRDHHKVSLFHLEDIYPGWNGWPAAADVTSAPCLRPLSGRESRAWTSLGLGQATTTVPPAATTPPTS